MSRWFRKLRPKRVLELGCGTGRITVPLAEAGSRMDFDVVGLDSQPEMLTKAQEYRLNLSSDAQKRLDFVHGDMRTWTADTRLTSS